MASITINKIIEGNVYLNGNNEAGHVTEVKFPSLQMDMQEQDALYPDYGFARNKGYGTAEHIAAIRKFGPCPLHRKSFIGKFL